MVDVAITFRVCVLHRAVLLDAAPTQGPAADVETGPRGQRPHSENQERQDDDSEGDHESDSGKAFQSAERIPPSQYKRLELR